HASFCAAWSTTTPRTANPRREALSGRPYNGGRRSRRSAMRVALKYGQETMTVDVVADRLVASHVEPTAPLADPVAAVRAALEAPFAFPPLRRALTPDDRVTIVVDERLPDVGHLLVPILEHIAAAGITANNMTLLCPPAESSRPGQAWLDALPEEFEDAICEV